MSQTRLPVGRQMNTKLGSSAVARKGSAIRSAHRAAPLDTVTPKSVLPTKIFNLDVRTPRSPNDARESALNDFCCRNWLCACAVCYEANVTLPPKGHATPSFMARICPFPQTTDSSLASYGGAKTDRMGFIPLPSRCRRRSPTGQYSGRRR